MSPAVAALDVVKALLGKSKLVALNYLELSMRRKDDALPIEPGSQFPAQLEIGYQILEEAAIYRVRVAVDRPDLEVEVVVAVMYTVPPDSGLADEAVAQMFGEKIVLPTAYPYARAKIGEITADTGLPPVLLDLIDLTRGRPDRLIPVDESQPDETGVMAEGPPT